MAYTILLAEEERNIRELIADYFSEKSSGTITVEAAADGNAALGRIEARDYDLILLDVMLAVMAGFTCCWDGRRHSPCCTA
nr:response regulator [uncultured Agathobaculum sp.]